MYARRVLWWASALGALCGARELDPAACAARFDVQRDKIIRTEESRDMGARYLSELDVGARAECLRLCCETDSCDVFVYEEKGPGSCYLFKCGPPEDFRCKFTAHGNFSSGVLALSRRLAELQDRDRLAEHERELASLRSGGGGVTAAPPSTARAPPAGVAPQPPAAPEADAARPAAAAAARCSRYQFACRHGGECIAVYNACDGVPQCADGSDEAPELGCPPPAAPPAPATRAPPPPPPPPPAPRSTQAPRAPLLQESMEALAAGDSLAAGDPLAAEDPLVAGGAMWPHRLAQAQPQHRYSEAGPSSHIFSHKGGLLQEAEAAPPPPPPPAPYPPFEPPWPRHAWTQQQGLESMGGWGGGGGGAAYPRLEWPAGAARRAWPVPPPRSDPEPPYAPPKSMAEVPPAAPYAGRQQTLRDSAKKGLELEGRPSPAAPAPPPPPAAPPRLPERAGPEAAARADSPKHDSKAPAEAATGGGARAAAARVAEPDGPSEHPPAAVLLLVLGMAMTVGLGGMAACRAGAARRRLRRGKPFAHDADYLVNGMYL